MPESLVIYLLILWGFFIGTLGSVMGNSLPLALAGSQLLLPQQSFGSLVGMSKLAGVVRGTGFVMMIYKKLEWKIFSSMWLPLCIGTLLGVTLLSKLNSQWAFPILIFAYLITEFSPKFAHHLKKSHLLFAALALGVYIGFLGAGIRAIFMSFLRLKFPENNRIALLKIHCSCISSSLAIIAVIGHFFHHNIKLETALPFAGGAFFGGLLGGLILKKFTIKSAKVQVRLMRASFGLGIIVSGYLFFQS